MPGVATKTIEERFFSKVLMLDGGCHLWTASVDRQGYGRFNIGNIPVLAHRVAWQLAGNELPTTPLCLDHLCRNRSCVHVAHLEVVTWGENLKRGELSKAQRPDLTKCQKGMHEWTPDNIYVGRDGKRRCGRCISNRRR